MGNYETKTRVTSVTYKFISVHVRGHLETIDFVIPKCFAFIPVMVLSVDLSPKLVQKASERFGYAKFKQVSRLKPIPSVLTLARENRGKTLALICPSDE